MFAKLLLVLCIHCILKKPENHEANAFYNENYTDFIGSNKLLVRYTGCCVSELKCGKLCFNHHKCVSFNYYDVYEKCQLHSDIIPANSATLLSYPGSKYFIMSEGAIQCPDREWNYFQNSCYLFSNYTAHWSNATSICASLNANLAIVSSEEESAFLVSLSKQRIIGSSVGFWLDGTDALTEGKWVWSTTGENLTYTNWSDGEPNDSNGEDCAGMNKYISYKWNDAGCDVSNLQFICEKLV